MSYRPNSLDEWKVDPGWEYAKNPWEPGHAERRPLETFMSMEQLAEKEQRLSRAYPSPPAAPVSAPVKPMKVESKAEAEMLGQALREHKIRPENVQRAEQALREYRAEAERKASEGQEMPAGRLGGGVVPDIMRGSAEGVIGNVTGPYDLMRGIGKETGAGGLLGLLASHPALGPQVQKWIDRYTTKPRTAGGKALETGSGIVAGALAGPKLPRFSSVNPAVRQFLKENPNVVLPPGMRRGGKANYLEQQLAKVHPFTKAARAKTVQQWNVGDINRVLRDIKAPELPKGVEGRKALRYLHAQISAGYDRVLKGVKLDPDTGSVPLRSRMQQIKQAYSGLDAEQKKVLDHVIDEIVLQQPPPAAMAAQGVMAARSGVAPQIPAQRDIKEIDRVLRSESRRAVSKNTHQHDRLLEALKDIHGAVDDVGREQNGKLWEEKLAHDRSWAEWASDVRAAGKGGFFTPASKRQAMQRYDPSRDKRATKMGTHPGTERLDRAESILGATEPDSGTPATMAMLGLLGAHELPAPLNKATMAAVAAPIGLYNQPMLSALQRRALRETPKAFSGPGAAFGASQTIQQGETPPLNEQLAKSLGVVQ